MIARLLIAATCIGLVHGLCGPVAALQWTAHTSSRDVIALSPSSSAVWAGSSGGVFRYDTGTGEITRFTAAEGLHDVQPRAVVYDEQRAVVWTGYADGAIDRIDVQTGRVTTYFDITRSDRFPSKEINRLHIVGDSLLIATAFGLVVFDPIRAEVRDTYSQLGSLASPVAVRDILVATVPQGGIGLWLATDQGIAYAPLDAPNLQDPAAWEVERDVRPSADLNAIAAFEGTIYVGSNWGLSRRESGGQYVNTSLTSRAVLDFALMPDRLLVLTTFNVLAAFASGGALVLADGFVNLRSIAISADGSMWVGDAETGLNHFARPAGNDRPALLTGNIYPDGPYDSPFGDLFVDDGGALWTAAVEGLPRSGFYRLAGDGVWTSFTERFMEELAGRSNFWRVYADGQGNAWAGSRGGGLVQIDASEQITLYDQSNSTLEPAAGVSGFTIVSGMASDQDGALWVTNTVASRPLHLRAPDGGWTALDALSCARLGTTTSLGAIIVDSSGLKWIVVQSASDLRLSTGILVLNTRGTPADQSDDECQYFGGRGASGQGLPDDQINAVAEDNKGRIWIGTDEGPAYFISSTFAATDASVQAVWPVWTQGSESVYMLRGLIINDIVADPAGRLWFATNEGLYMVNDEGGFSLEAHYTAGNSPLFSDIVNAVAVDGGTGQVFIATDKGLISYQSHAINPAAQAQDLFVYPNPAIFSDGRTPQIFIEKLVDETTIKILKIDGEEVVSFPARGGKTVWDGRDRSGKLVPSGIYLVAAVSSGGKGTAFGKIAVIH